MEGLEKLARSMDRLVSGALRVANDRDDALRRAEQAETIATTMSRIVAAVCGIDVTDLNSLTSYGAVHL
jgi:hypothetical protein